MGEQCRYIQLMFLIKVFGGRTVLNMYAKTSGMVSFIIYMTEINL